jgi:hypothetical protein
MTVFATFASLELESVVPLVLLYIGPDVFLPLTSALAAIAGVLLMFWHRVMGFVNRILGRSARQVTDPPPTPGTDAD